MADLLAFEAVDAGRPLPGRRTPPVAPDALAPAARVTAGALDSPPPAPARRGRPAPHVELPSLLPTSPALDGWQPHSPTRRQGRTLAAAPVDLPLLVSPVPPPPPSRGWEAVAPGRPVARVAQLSPAADAPVAIVPTPTGWAELPAGRPARRSIAAPAVELPAAPLLPLTLFAPLGWPAAADGRPRPWAPSRAEPASLFVLPTLPTGWESAPAAAAPRRTRPGPAPGLQTGPVPPPPLAVEGWQPAVTSPPSPARSRPLPHADAPTPAASLSPGWMPAAADRGGSTRRQAAPGELVSLAPAPARPVLLTLELASPARTRRATPPASWWVEYQPPLTPATPPTLPGRVWLGTWGGLTPSAFQITYTPGEDVSLLLSAADAADPTGWTVGLYVAPWGGSPLLVESPWTVSGTDVSGTIPSAETALQAPGVYLGQVKRTDSGNNLVLSSIKIVVTQAAGG